MPFWLLISGIAALVLKKPVPSPPPSPTAPSVPVPLPVPAAVTTTPTAMVNAPVSVLRQAPTPIPPQASKQAGSAAVSNAGQQGPSQQSKDVQAFATDTKDAAIIASAGRTLFGEGNNFLSPTQIANLLQVMGVKISPDEKIGLDVAQIVIAGGAVCTAAETGAEIGSYASPTAAACQAAVDILATTGIIKKDDPNVILLEVALDIILIVASYGSNIMAWIDLAVNIYKLTEIPAGLKAEAQNEANKAVADWYHSRETAQYNALISNFQAYHDGDMDSFDFINLVAKESPDFFIKTFPNFEPYTDQERITYTVSVTEGSDFCGVQVASGSGSASKSVDTIDYSQGWMQTVLMETMVEPILAPFEIFANENPKYMTINDLALMASVPPYLTFIPPEMDVASYMAAAYMSPGDLGSTVIEDAINSNSLYQNQQDFEPPITFNGVAYRDPTTEVQYENTTAYQNEMDQIRLWDTTGAVDKLFALDNVTKVINDWSSVVVDAGTGNQFAGLGGTYGALNNNNLVNFPMYPGMVMTPQMFANLWRYPLQYIKALSMVQQMRTSTILNAQSKPFAKYIANVDDFMAAHKDLLTKTLARAANRRALQTIASYFGTTPDNIELISDPTTGAPAQFRVKSP